VFINSDQGGNHPDANTANKEEKIYPKSAALDLLFGQRGVVGGRRRWLHLLDMARMTTIMTSRLASTYCVVLHKTTTTKVRGSIDRLRLGLGLRAEGQEIVNVNVNEGGEIKMKGDHQSRVRNQKVTAAPTTTPARSQSVLVIALMSRLMA
jgi:hypothetical protein